MTYQVTMKNVGRNNMCCVKSFDHEPDYEDLYAMVRSALVSSEIDFCSQDSGYPVRGRVTVGGWRGVGDFTVEEI